MKGKMVTQLLAGIFLVILTCVPSQARENILNINSIKSGSSLDVFVDLIKDSGAVAAQFDIVYDSQALKVIGDPEVNSILSSAGFKVTSSISVPGIIRVVIAPPVTSPLPIIPSGTLIKLKFSTLSDDASTPMLTNVILGDAEAKEIF